MRLVALCIFFQTIALSTFGQGFSRLYNLAPSNAPFQNSNAAGIMSLENGAIFWGNHTSEHAGTLHSYIVKIDTFGNVLWQATLGDSGQMLTHAGNSSLLPLRNSNYLYLPWMLLGSNNPSITYGHTILTWLSNTGDVIKKIQVNDNIQIKTISQCIELSNGDLLCTGTSSSSTLNASNNFAERQHWLVRYDSTGELLWEKSHSISIRDNPIGTWPHMLRIHNMGDSLFVVGGYKTDSPRVRIWSSFAAFDQNGNPLWERFIHGQNGLLWGNENNSEAVPVGDSLWFFVTTLSDTLFPGPGGVPVFHGNMRGIYGYLNNQGDTLRVKNIESRYPSPNFKQTAADQARVLSDGSKLILFGLGVDGAHSQITSIQKLKPNDELQWERWFVYDAAQHFIQQRFTYGMSVAPDGGIYLAGTYQILNNNAGDSTGLFAWVSRTDSFGCVLPGCHLGDSIFNTPTSLPVVQYQQALEVKLYPNPAQSQVAIEVLGEALPMGLSVSVFNYSGQQLLPEQPMPDGKAELAISSLAPGLYLCRIRSAQGVITYQKLVKQ